MRAALALALLISSSMLARADGLVSVRSATVASTTGPDAALTLTVVNESGRADAIVRARCEASQFVGKFVLDTGGEGDANARETPRLEAPVGTTVLGPQTRFLKLIQLKRPLQAGEVFSCELTFANQGHIVTPVSVQQAER